MKQNWTVVYYNERVKRDVFALPAGNLADYLRLLDLMQEFGADLRMPHSRAMGGGLFELRPKETLIKGQIRATEYGLTRVCGACERLNQRFPKGKEGIGRVFYCTHVGRHVVVLHSFVKKTQETPRNVLQVARVRLNEVRHD
ncbi:type II toxin-antitoxin system RelE/ParE family toxin [Burkholderia pseudomallei]|uniref:type II toxin-antitoxin system RelE/ParE family toxin n=1 Tax=Burkholderia pseudomallei TaxID=28450 RepID=UPI000491C4D7|nr:type II toxin-antitoxin system RelE/ParE family toxin [Burkholderia pseudomallei]AJX95854.1 hypothetical protein BG24_1212 [Burkholderia pseudomallei PB08298010]MCW0080480.1 type II toxin-antitoxin system RelE/ParE family toxin [Burkholderia pseudomallei]OMR20365.1 hypothetical protein AQ721_18980 [Burkholderia pseudomallei]OMZ82849.1 hypothetical protein AQ870_00380 [Burkholderia pseudomallei]CAJ2989638.1 bacteriophage protein [Burkholderia pseudomallei]